jgi:photosystem II stability/assembly factor-like uncharacterized protein
MDSATDGWAVGDAGTILHYTGGQWMPVSSPTGEDLYNVTMESATESWAVGDYGTIVHYANGVWISVYSPV